MVDVISQFLTEASLEIKKGRGRCVGSVWLGSWDTEGPRKEKGGGVALNLVP